MKKWLDKIWASFDKDDPTEWFLVCSGLLVVVVILTVETYNWIGGYFG